MAEGVDCFEVTQWLDDAPYPARSCSDRCCDEDVRDDAALLKSTESAVRAMRALQSEVFADECSSRTARWTPIPGCAAGSCAR
jgi:hypothetical protein